MDFSDTEEYKVLDNCLEEINNMIAATAQAYPGELKELFLLIHGYIARADFTSTGGFILVCMLLHPGFETLVMIMDCPFLIKLLYGSLAGESKVTLSDSSTLMSHVYRAKSLIGSKSQLLDSKHQSAWKHSGLQC